MSTVYLRSGNQFNPANESDLQINATLPVGNYIVKAKPMSGALYFEEVQRFPALGKVYGDAKKRGARIMNTYMDRPSSTGVWLTGEKGSGKSMLAKLMSLNGYDLGIPTIIINEQFAGDSFNQLMQELTQPCIVLFDEFEKVYDHEHQEKILTLLDGSFPTKKLFILTTNDSSRVDNHMRNRPGRIFYMKEYQGLDKDFIGEYCYDVLKEELKHHIPAIIRATMVFHSFNFDMLKALVEEMNRYMESPLEAMEMLNMRPSDESLQYRVELWDSEGKIIPEDDYYPSGKTYCSPLGDREHTFHWNRLINPSEVVYGGIQIEPGPGGEVEDAMDDIDPQHKNQDVTFVVTDLKDIKEGQFVFQNDEGFKLRLTKTNVGKFGMSMAF